jgi:aspartate 1-decarboxylase
VSVDVWNCSNGNRFRTYAIDSRSGSGEICLNGAAAHLAKPGDIVIIASFVEVDEDEISRLRPRRVFVDARNRPLDEPRS